MKLFLVVMFGLLIVAMVAVVVVYVYVSQQIHVAGDQLLINALPSL